MIKFSIVTITYNAEAVVERTLNSILGQTYPQVEHIIVDGASRDDTLRMENRYKEVSDGKVNGHVVSIKSEPDGGLYDAMNKGLGRITGDYVCFMNAGDTLPEPTTLEQIADKVRLFMVEDGDRELPAVLYGDTDWTDNDGNFVCHRPLTPPERLTWRAFSNGMLVCHQAFYARTDIARSTLFNLHYRHSADVDWCIRVMKEADKRGLSLLNLHATVALYQREGQTTKFRRASLFERFSVMRCHYGLPLTVLKHIWFVFRAIKRKL